MQRRLFFVGQTSFVALLAAAPWLSSCTSSRPLVVGLSPWIGYETLYLAREFNWLPAGVQLQENKTASDVLAALKSGQADAACLTLDEMLRVRSAGVPLTAVLVFDVSAGADMVLARPAIKRLADLANKRLGLEKKALGALVLAKLLEAAKLPASALTLVELPPDQQLAAWRKNEVDAVITFEPTASLLRHEGAQRLFDSRQMPDTIFDVLAVRRDRLQDRRTALRALVAGHFRALNHIRTSRQDAIYRISAHEDVGADDVQLALAEVNLPSLAANRSYLAVNDSLLLRAARTISALMTQNGLLAQEDALEDLISPIALPSDERR